LEQAVRRAQKAAITVTFFILIFPLLIDQIIVRLFHYECLPRVLLSDF
jgi:hypothetical protein